MFKEEGQYRCKITRVQVIEGRFDKEPDRQEVEVTVTSGQESGSWYGSLSGDYIQAGNNAGKMEIQRTLEIINEIAPIGSDLTRLDELLGKDVDVNAKKNKNGYMVVYLGGRSAKQVDPRAAMAKMQALLSQQNQAGQFGGQPQQSQPQAQQGQVFGGNGQVPQAQQFGQFHNNQQFQQPQQGQFPGFVNNNGNPFAR